MYQIHSLGYHYIHIALVYRYANILYGLLKYIIILYQIINTILIFDRKKKSTRITEL